MNVAFVVEYGEGEAVGRRNGTRTHINKGKGTGRGSRRNT